METSKNSDTKTEEIKANFLDYNYVTDFNEEKISITWRINNIHRYSLQLEDFIEIPFSIINNNYKELWTLRFYPSRRWVRDFYPADAAGFSFNRISKSAGPLPLKCRLSYKRYLLDDSPFSFSKKGETEIAWNSDKIQPVIGLFEARSLKHPQNLVIRCIISFLNVSNERVDSNHTQGILNSPSLYKDFSKLYKSGSFSDVTLLAEDQQFPAHKAILSSRSEVFDAMFRHDMQENQTGIVKVEDIEPEILNDVLHYIYSGTIDNLNIEKAIPLYIAATKYLLDELKECCVNVILDNLSVENVCMAAALIEQHSDPKLEKAILNMFRHYKEDIFERQEWQELVQDSERQALVSSILEAVNAELTTRFS